MLSTVGTHHRIPYLRKPEVERLGFSGTLKHMKACFAHRSFLAILSFGVLKYTAIGMTGALTLYFGTFFWEFSSKQLAVLALDGFIGAALAMVVAPKVSRRWGKRNSAFVLAVVAVVASITPYVLRFNGLFFENGDPRLLPTLFSLTALFATCGIASAMLVHAMIGDVVDESSLRTGRHAAGLYYSANSFMQKCVSGLGVLVAGLLIAAVGIPDGPQNGEVTPEMIHNLAFIYIPTVTALYLVGACFLYHYRIDRASHEANLAKLKAQEVVEG